MQSPLFGVGDQRLKQRFPWPRATCSGLERNKSQVGLDGATQHVHQS